MIQLPEDLSRKFDYAYAAVCHGVTMDPGNPESAAGVSKDEALDLADDFLVAFHQWVTNGGAEG